MRQFNIVKVWYQNDWGLYGHRDEMLARALARHPAINKVLHIEPPVSIERTLSALHYPTHDDNLALNIARLSGTADNGVVCYTPCLPYPDLDPCEVTTVLGKQIADVMDRYDIFLKPVILWLNPPHPFSEMLLDLYGDRSSIIVAELDDDHLAYYEEGTPKHDERMRVYRKVIARSDCVFTGAKTLADRWKEFNPDACHIPNAVDLTEYDNDHPCPQEIASLRRPVATFMGNMLSRMHCDLMEDVCRMLPEVSFAFVGPPRSEIYRRLAHYENVHFLGACPRPDVPSYLVHSDVLFMPHTVNHLTDGMDPQKLYEYLASGRPIVTTGVAGTEKFADVLKIADTAEEFARGIVQAIDADTPEKQAARRKAVEAHTWDERVKGMFEFISRTYSPEKQRVRRTTNRYYDYARPEIQDLVPADARTILDIGCAAGSLGAALKGSRDKRIEITGIEVDPDAAARAKKKLDEVILGDVEQLAESLPSERYDCVIMADVLEHLRDPAAVLKRAAQALTPDGTAIISLPNVRHWSVIRALLEGTWHYADSGILDKTHLRFFTRETMMQLFEEAGLDVANMITVTWGNEAVPDDILGVLRDSGLAVGRLQDESRAYQYIFCAQRKKTTAKLTSIVILTMNELNYTRMCVESIQRNTPEPCELIFVDNGSTDGTVEYLRSIEGATVIENGENRGFAAGCNQGIEAACGDYVLLLNNDTVVTKGWLGRMIAHAERDEKAGIVGPRTNYAAGYQMIRNPKYGSLEELEPYAESLRLEHFGQAETVPGLIGFCMLIKRCVIDKVGLFDERFKIGNWEDADYCMRVKQAGYNLVMAQDVFVHHFGSRTFVGNGIDLRGHLEENKRLFEEKWGISRPVDEGQIVEAEKLQVQGRTLVEQGSLVEAAQMFTESIRLQPQNALCFNDLGVALFQLGRIEAARKNLQRALLLDPNLDDARLNLEAIDRMPIPA